MVEQNTIVKLLILFGYIHQSIYWQYLFLICLVFCLYPLGSVLVFVIQGMHGISCTCLFNGSYPYSILICLAAVVRLLQRPVFVDMILDMHEISSIYLPNDDYPYPILFLPRSGYPTCVKTVICDHSSGYAWDILYLFAQRWLFGLCRNRYLQL